VRELGYTLSSETANANDLEFLGACLSSLDAARVAAGRNIAEWLGSNGASDGHQKVVDGLSVLGFRRPGQGRNAGSRGLFTGTMDSRVRMYVCMYVSMYPLVQKVLRKDSAPAIFPVGGYILYWYWFFVLNKQTFID
jgi:hypothetical protein